MDIPSTQNWKAMKTMSRKDLNIGTTYHAGSVSRTFSLGIVQPMAIVRKFRAI